MKTNPCNRLVQHGQSVESRAEDERDVSAPLGFATRVVALAREQASVASLSALLERRGWHALGMAGAIAVMSVVINLPAVAESIEQEVLEADDPITALWDLS